LLRIAVACSGLGHVTRGIEAWAQDTYVALRRRNVAAVLFAASPVPNLTVEVLPCLKRTSSSARRCADLFRPVGGWRYSLGSPYEVEQATFSFGLWRRIRRDYDILHVQDPNIALMMEWLYRAGLSRPRVILANGTGEAERVLRRMSVVQELTPAAARETSRRKPPGQSVFAVPNLVNVAIFNPSGPRAMRHRVGLPDDAFIVLACAALRKVHKRIDYLVEEFARHAAGPAGERSVLVIAGAREDETDEVMALGRARLGSRVHFLVDHPRESMPELYRAADAFALPSLFEPFGIVLLEAMATGLPVLCHDTPAFRYIAGPAGMFGDFSRPGGLAAALDRAAREDERMGFARAARAHVAATFSEDVVIAEIIDMYGKVAAGVAHDVSDG
jgi:1,2-diacylglycerol 3-alpha-glucosyltransferase